jgi:uncharacterized membrane protein YdjX (TVP38/TMEM64 family)
VIGCLLLYTLMRRGGQAVYARALARKTSSESNAFMRATVFWRLRFRRLPPPMPFKIFVATAGALEYPRWRFIITVMIARSLRYYIEGVLAVLRRGRAAVLKDNGMAIMSVVTAAALIALAVYLFSTRRREIVKTTQTSAPEITRAHEQTTRIEQEQTPAIERIDS